MNFRALGGRLASKLGGQKLSARQYELPCDCKSSDALIVQNWRFISDDPKYEEKRIPDGDGLALYHLVKYAKPASTMEIGYYSGASTIAICSGLRDLGQEPSMQHVALDLEDWHGGPQNVRAAGFGDFVRFVTGDSALTLPRLVNEGLTFDLIFIDGNHRFDFCLIDFFYSDRMLRNGGIVGFHDAGAEWPAVDKVVAFVESHRAYASLGRLSGIQLYRKLRADFENGKFDREAHMFHKF